MKTTLRDALDAHRYVLTTRQASSYGLSRHDLRSAMDAGGILRVARGGYVDAAAYRQASPQNRHCLRSRGVLAVLGAGFALSHHSAATAWSLPLLGEIPPYVHLVRLGEGQHRRRPDYTVHRSLPGATTSWRNGLPVIEPAYAILGVAALGGVRAAVVALDAGLRTGIVTPERYDAMLAAGRGWPGHEPAVAAGSLAHSSAESPGESLTRILLQQLGYAARPQVEVTAHSVGFVARVDFLLSTHPVIVEFDGKVKYERAGGQPDRRALVREKAREDMLRSLGFEVVRLVWADLDRPDHVRRLIEAACARTRNTVN